MKPRWRHKCTSLLILSELIFLFVLLIRFFPVNLPSSSSCTSREAASQDSVASSSNAKKFIKWVDFDVNAEALRQALRFDVDSYGQEPHFNWLELLAYLGARYGGDFSRYREKDMEELIQTLQQGTPMEELTKDMKYYPYYLEAYGAVLGGMTGAYEIQIRMKPPGKLSGSRNMD